MKKQTIIWIIAGAVVLIGGVGAYFALTGSKDSEQSMEHAARGSTPSFAPKNLAGQSYVATLTGTQADGKSYTATIENDGKGTLKNTSTVDGKTTTTYTDNGTYITCVSEALCYKLATPNTSTNDQYTASDDKIAEWKKSISYEGKMDCDSGTCDMWKVSIGGTDTEVMTDSTGRVVESKVTSNGNTFTTVYVYKAVTITLPANVQESPYQGIAQ